MSNVIEFPKSSRSRPVGWNGPKPEHILASERNYRRGFFQGVEAAIAEMERHTGPTVLRAWRDALYAWRMRAARATRPEDAAESPPGPRATTSGAPPSPEAA